MINGEFSLIEDQTIDIDSIEEVKFAEGCADTDDTLLHHEDRINELIKAVKHLNKEIQSIKEK